MVSRFYFIQTQKSSESGQVIVLNLATGSSFMVPVLAGYLGKRVDYPLPPRKQDF